MGRWYQPCRTKYFRRPGVRWKFSSCYTQFLHFISRQHKWGVFSFVFNFQCAHFLPVLCLSDCTMRLTSQTVSQEFWLTAKEMRKRGPRVSWKCCNTWRQERREAQSTEQQEWFFESRKPAEVLLECWVLGRLEERVPEAVKTEFWLSRRCCVQHRRNQTGLQQPGIMFVLERKKKKKSYSNSQKKHSPAIICTTQVEKSPISP